VRLAIVSQPFDGVLPPNQNSIGIWTNEVARRLAARHDVTVYLQSNDTLKTKRDLDGVHYFPISLRPDDILQRRWSPGPDADPLVPAYARRRHWLGYALQVAWDLRRRGCDVAHVLNSHQFAPTLKLFHPSLRVVLNMRCEWLSQLDRGLIGRHLRAVDRIVGCSTHVTGLIEARFPDFADRCRTLPNAIDTETFVPLSNRAEPPPVRLLFVGRVSPEKGVHVLIEAMKRVTQVRPDVRLDVVGGMSQLPGNYLVDISDDPLVSDLARFYGTETLGYSDLMKSGVEQAGLGHVIAFHGQLPYAEVVAHLQNADLLINPSLSEAFGRGPVEAMACGTPVICAATGGMTDTVDDGVTGLLTAPGNAEALAAAILALLADPGRLAAMGFAGRRRAVELYSWDAVVRDLESIYTEMTDRD